MKPETHDSEKDVKVPRQIHWEIKDLVAPIVLRRALLWRAGIGACLLVAAGLAAWAFFFRPLSGKALVAEMVASSGGMESWNAISDGRFVRVHTRFDERGAPTGTEEVTYYFRKGPGRFNIALESRGELGRILLGRDDEGYWAMREGEPVAPVTAARSLGMMCESEECAPLCGAEMAFYRFSLPFKLSDPGVRPRIAGSGELNGVPVWHLEVTFDEGIGADRWLFHVDRESKRIRKVEHYPSVAGDVPPEEIYWSEYQPADGLVISHRQSYYRSNGSKLEEYVVREADFRSPLPDELFRRPLSATFTEADS